ncbi:hypothetical protein D9M72_637580 [compost metagenome]
MAGVVGKAVAVETGIGQALLKAFACTQRLAQLIDLRVHLTVADLDALALGFLPEQFLVDQVIERLLTQAFVHAGVSYAGQGPALGLQVVGKIALQTHLADRHAVDLGCRRSLLGLHLQRYQA